MNFHALFSHFSFFLAFDFCLQIWKLQYFWAQFSQFNLNLHWFLKNTLTFCCYFTRRSVLLRLNSVHASVETHVDETTDSVSLARRASSLLKSATCLFIMQSNNSEVSFDTRQNTRTISVLSSVCVGEESYYAPKSKSPLRNLFRVYPQYVPRWTFLEWDCDLTIIILLHTSVVLCFAL